jgi:nucleoside-diphosphate-sugar epimerase
LYLAATHPAAVGETFVLAGRETMTTVEMVEQVARALGRPAPRMRVPLWPFLAAAILMEKTLSPLGIQPLLHRRRLDFFRKSFIFSTEKAQRELGYRPLVSFAEGTVETASWYRAQGYL